LHESNASGWRENFLPRIENVSDAIEQRGEVRGDIARLKGGGFAEDLRKVRLAFAKALPYCSGFRPIAMRVSRFLPRSRSCAVVRESWASCNLRVTFGFVFAEALLADAAAGTSVLVGRAEDLPLLMGDLHGGYGSSGKGNFQ
jgi:hypothetical protein